MPFYVQNIHSGDLTNTIRSQKLSFVTFSPEVNNYTGINV
jgi:hypothetical protein